MDIKQEFRAVVDRLELDYGAKELDLAEEIIFKFLMQLEAQPICNAIIQEGLIELTREYVREIMEDLHDEIHS